MQVRERRAARRCRCKLGVAGTAETVNVTAATPVIDIKRDTTTTNVTIEELQNIPSARDPWVVMQTVPTVYMDRVNVGGAESGQQSNYNAKGAQDDATTPGASTACRSPTWARPASSAFYYDFDSFQEMAITTGGADAQNPTGGVQLNMVLRKGIEHAARQRPLSTSRTTRCRRSTSRRSSPRRSATPPARATAPTSTTTTASTSAARCCKDRLWVWGTMAKTDINLLTLTGDLDKTTSRTTRSRPTAR